MGKHAPNSCEYSHPHQSESAGGKTHVDVYHYGSDGKLDKSATMKHSTDKGDVSYGNAVKNNSSSKSSSTGSNNSGK